MTKKTKHTDPFFERESQKYDTPVPSREFILAELVKWKEPVKRAALLEHFQLTDPELIEALRRRVKAMVRDGQLLKTPQGYIPIVNLETCEGILVMSREGEGYLRTAQAQHITLSGPALRGYYDGDKIEAQIIQIDVNGNSRGRIIRLVEAVVPKVIGRIIKARVDFELLPFDRKFSCNFTIPKGKHGKAKNGDIVQVEVLRDEKYQYHIEPVAQVIDVLGDFSTPGIEIQMAIRKFGLPDEWPKAVLKEAEKLSPKSIQLSEGRKDLTGLDLVTIDGEDAKDFDDAVYCQPREKGGWQLWVAIADVSHYVKQGSALDVEAVKRGNSTYFPGCVIPMLPEKLSNDLCSLKPKVPRLCLVCQMSIDENGNIMRSQFYRALMHSKARLTYTEVAQIIEGNAALAAEYEPLVPALKDLHALYLALNKQRKHRGAIDFDTFETRILFDKSGKIKSIVPTERNVAHKMIEESMLAANVSAAKFIERHKQKALFRIHDRPPTDKLSNLREFLSELGLDLPGQQEPSPKDFTKLIHSIQDREDKHVIETVMLRSLSQAQYHPKNIGHFGLAYETYLHFTSPIRRYPDLMVHRTINHILENTQDADKKIDFEKMGLHCSEAERRSDDATRDATLALKCHYMQDKIGESFRGVISGVASFGIFVELKDIYVEGLVHVTGLGQEYFNYDAPNHRMIGDRTRTVYRLGDSVEVKVAHVDVEGKKIDLELLNEVPAQPRPSKKKSDSRKRRPRTKKKKS